MNFKFTEEQLMVRDAARDYTQTKIIEDAIERDEKAISPTEHIKNIKDLGFFGKLLEKT